MRTTTAQQPGLETLVQAAADLKLRLLPIAPEPGLLKRSEKSEYYRAVIPAKAYPFNKEDVVTTAATEWLAHIPGTVPKDVVYYVTKGIMSQKMVLIYKTGRNNHFH